MVTYVAFLRAINVAGQKLIKMQELAAALSRDGFRNVRTYIQSGNVIFESRSANASAVRRKLERTLLKGFGYEVTVILKRLVDLERLITEAPFNKIRPDKKVMLFVVLLADEPQIKTTLPFRSEKEGLTLIEVKDRTAFVVARRKQNGWFGYPNAFVEKKLRVAGTTRNWNTLNKIIQAAEKQ
jgi:uncharacterized protein (DUF1697 family)